MENNKIIEVESQVYSGINHINHMIDRLDICIDRALDQYRDDKKLASEIIINATETKKELQHLLSKYMELI